MSEVRGSMEMADAPTRRDRERKDEPEGPEPRREARDPAESEWVLERIQQTFDTRRE